LDDFALHSSASSRVATLLLLLRLLRARVLHTHSG
jgi:hypothetical protein